MRMQAYLSITSLTKAAVVNPYSEGLLICIAHVPTRAEARLDWPAFFICFRPLRDPSSGQIATRTRTSTGKRLARIIYGAAVQKPSSSEQSLAVLGEKSSMRPVLRYWRPCAISYLVHETTDWLERHVLQTS